jgi:hypothetical protein
VELIENLKDGRLDGVPIAKLLKKYELPQREIVKLLRENGFKVNSTKQIVLGDPTEIFNFLQDYNRNEYSELVYHYNEPDYMLKLELKTDKFNHFYVFSFLSKKFNLKKSETHTLDSLNPDFHIFEIGNGWKFIFSFMEDAVTAWKYLPETHPRTSDKEIA